MSNLEITKEQFQIETLTGILKVQHRLLELMDEMKNPEESEDDEDEEFGEFEAVLDLYRTLAQIVES